MWSARPSAQPPIACARRSRNAAQPAKRSTSKAGDPHTDPHRDDDAAIVEARFSVGCGTLECPACPSSPAYGAAARLVHGGDRTTGQTHMARAKKTPIIRTPWYYHTLTTTRHRRSRSSLHANTKKTLPPPVVPAPAVVVPLSLFQHALVVHARVPASQIGPVPS